MKSLKSRSASPYDRFSWSIHIFLRNCLRFICFDVFDEHFRRSFGFWLMAFWFFVSFCCTAFSMYKNRNDLTSLLQLVGTIGAIIQTSAKFSFVDDFKRLAWIPTFVQQIYRTNSSDVRMKNEDFFKICERYAKLTEKICWFMLSYVHVFIVFGAVQPFLIYVFTSKWVTSIGIDIPGIDNARNTVEYAINVVFEISVLSLVCWVEVAVETVIIINFICLSMLADMIQQAIVTLQTEVNSRQLNAKTIENKLIHIVLMHQKYIDAISVLGDGFFRPCLVLILGAFSFTTVGVVILVTDNSVPIVPIIFLSHGLLQENCICYLGTLLTNSVSKKSELFYVENDRIRGVMKSFDWHLLPYHLQKNYQIMLHHIDQPRDIYIGGISRLSLETSVLIMRSLYSYTMILFSLDA